MKALLACLLILATALASAAGLPDRVRFSVAIERGDVAQAREWLAAGLPPDFEGSLIGSGLMIGAWEGSIPMMALFLSYGANVNAVNTHGETALLHASWKGILTPCGGSSRRVRNPIGRVKNGLPCTMLHLQAMRPLCVTCWTWGRM